MKSVDIMLFKKLKYRNDPIKRPAFFKRPPRISAQVISSMFNKRPAFTKRPLRLSTHPIMSGAESETALFENFAFL